MDAIALLNKFESIKAENDQAALSGSNSAEGLAAEIQAAQAAVSAFRSAGGSFDPHTTARFYQAELVVKQYR